MAEGSEGVARGLKLYIYAVPATLNNNYYSNSPDSQSGTLVFGIFASGAGNGSLGVNFDLSAHGPSVSTIPEPESYAMLLAGFGLMGAVIRRRSMNRNG
jgi:hypothetical protein